jgi:predicted enzyme related to lactoylglutathione lyase
VTTLASVSILAQDIDAVARFYQDVFGFEEIGAYRTPVFRALAARPVLLGIHGPEAYELVGLVGCHDRRGVTSMVNFEVDSRDEVGALAAQVVTQGGRLIKAPFVTYYGAFQAVLADPEGNVFRVNRMPG